MDMLSRRLFLQGMAAAGGLTAISSSLSQPAFGVDTGGYKALVGIFLKGGLDAGDVIMPTNPVHYNALTDLREGLFASYRNANTPSRALNDLLGLSIANSGAVGGRGFGLVPGMSGLQGLFNAGEAAIVGNVGPLIEPTTRQSYQDRTVALPKKLFSHNDQQSTWMALDAEGQSTGWGGRFADLITAASPSTPSLYQNITVGSVDVFLSGETSRPFSVPGGNTPTLRISSSRSLLGGGDQGDATRARIREALLRRDFGSASILERDLALVSAQGIQDSEDFAEIQNSAAESLTTQFPDTSIGRQLQTVAETIAIRDSLLATRQIFYGSRGGFDTHRSQSNELPELAEEISDAFAAFRNAMVELGQWGNVAVFTFSEFGRTLNGNGNGTDHGWGGHHFVAGGAVQGGRVYGALPEPDPESGFYTENRGRLIPTVSVEQFGATLGGWFGLNASELASVFPNLANFNQTDLGFLGGATS
ncbi:MAG: DUF1501 domain-containing protein [Pseudomonadota bacterium]